MELKLREAYLLLAHYDAEKEQLVEPRLLEMSLNGVAMAELALRGRTN